MINRVFHREVIRMFAIITKEIQKNFEKECKGISPKNLPIICGYCGRACRQMEKEEGANRVSCMHCALAKYAENNQ